MNPSSWFGAGWDSRLQVLWEDGERVFCRGWRDGGDVDSSAVLAVVPASDPPTPRSLDRLAHEYGLKDELDGAWAVRPLSLVRERGQTVLLLEDPDSSARVVLNDINDVADPDFPAKEPLLGRCDNASWTVRERCGRCRSCASADRLFSCWRIRGASRPSGCSARPWKWAAFCASPSPSPAPSRKSTGTASCTRTSSRPISSSHALVCSSRRHSPGVIIEYLQVDAP